jgi:hypothetical protein
MPSLRPENGYCTYDFFDQCPHRMACAKCSFYMPKRSTAAALLEGKNNLLRMRQEIPLTDAEAAAVDDGASALDSLLNVLDVIREGEKLSLERWADFFLENYSKPPVRAETTHQAPGRRISTLPGHRLRLEPSPDR